MPAEAASAPFRPWADLDAGLVSMIAARCALREHASCRAVCCAWRSALPSPLSWPLAAPTRLHGDLHRPTGIGAAGCRCVGASRDGWLALVAGDAEAPAGLLLFNPFTGQEIPLDPELYEPTHEPAPKIVFSPSPTPLDFTAVSLCRPNRVAVQRASDGRSHIDDTGLLMDRDVVLVDVVYSDDDVKVYCLAKDGQVHVLHLNRRRRSCRRRRVPPMEVGPLPKLPRGAAVFPSPYDTISKFTDAKNLVLCDGVLYQVWRRPTGAGNATVAAPAGGVRRWIHIFEGDVFVLRFDPGNWPRSSCWSVVEAKDLRGNALFVGLNDAAVVRGEGVSANSVYYWDGLRGGDCEAVVYSMATGASVRWPAVSTGAVSSPAWYFLPAGDTHRVEAEATEVEDTSAEATSPELDEELDHSAHCLKKTMSLLGFLAVG
ncbi:unnamed protein product [Miscanthus lutarioriparius]|uniref:KIB1-4 beta-propeller domain-containing protein n=1 Tax=Miscanthus lutarioriparius TaxID=422564 RepID=A0A811PU80_9POAL|nr:unnamed protein product [Miscanthus lutarioriparius]